MDMPATLPTKPMAMSAAIVCHLLSHYLCVYTTALDNITLSEDIQDARVCACGYR
jgi:hypothetical protein